MRVTQGDFLLLRKKVYASLQECHRSWKYPNAILGNVRPSLLPPRVRLLDAYYVLMRAIDAAVDEDPSQDPVAFIDQKIAFVQDYRRPCDALEHLIANARSDLFAIDPSQVEPLDNATKALFGTWRFDAERRKYMETNGTPTLYSDEEITAYVTEMELYGVYAAAFAILGEDPQKIELIRPLVLAARRHHYFLRDLAEDVTAGYVNISREELSDDISALDSFVAHSSSYNTRIAACHADLALLPFLKKAFVGKGIERERKNYTRAYLDGSPTAVRHWAYDQVSTGKALLASYRSSHAQRELGLVTRALLYSSLERRAELFFAEMDQILSR